MRSSRYRTVFEPAKALTNHPTKGVRVIEDPKCDVLYLKSDIVLMNMNLRQDVDRFNILAWS